MVAAMMTTWIPMSPSNAIASMSTSPPPLTTPSTEPERSRSKEIDFVEETPSMSLKFLNFFYAMLHKRSGRCKIVLKVLPIFGCTIMLNCCLAQLSTFSVQQAATMDTKLGSLKVPPASLPIFPVVFIMLLAPVYDQLIIPFMRKAAKSEMGIFHLQRIGIGLFLSNVAMGAAALVEIKLKRATAEGLDTTHPLPITFLWIAFQYLFLGSADLFTLAGLMEFCFTEAPASMRSLATSLSFASLAMGIIVSIVNNVTGHSNHKPWLSGINFNHYKLERFYWLMCVLSLLNFLHYFFLGKSIQISIDRQA